jgi:DNA-binding transcriptional regulator YiaG
MKTPEYRAALKKLALTQVNAAQMLGVADRTSRRWALGEDLSGPASIIMRALVKGWLTVEQVNKLRDKAEK